MSDKTFTTPGGKIFVTRRLAGNKIEVTEGASKDTPLVTQPEIRATRLDSGTKRIFASSPRGIKLFWIYARGNKRVLSWPGGSLELDVAEMDEGSGAGTGSMKPLKLTMPGKVLSVKVKEGDVVEAGQGLVIVEAMKMENLLAAAAKARVAKVHVKEGDRLESGSTLITFAPVE